MSEQPQPQPRPEDLPAREAEPRSEAETATPPRGIPQGASPPADPAVEPAAESAAARAAPEPASVWGAVAAPAAPRQRRAARIRVLQIAALVLGLAGTGWISTEQFRTEWMDVKGEEPVAGDETGVATLDGLTVSLVEATDLGETPSLPGTDWQPPAGFHAWRVVLDTTSTNTELFACDVALVDGDRHFLANYFVDSFADGYEWSYTCGVPEPGDDIPQQQALLVLAPADAEPTIVEITSTSFGSGYIALEID